MRRVGANACVRTVLWLGIALVVGTLALLATTPRQAHAAVLLNEAFNQNSANFSGSGGFASKYCTDTWTTALNGGVISHTDDGCSCAATGSSACDYAVYTAQGKSCYKSEPVDNLLVAGESGWTDYELSVRLRNVDDDTMGIIFRYKNTANYYAIWLSRDIGPGVSAACDGSFPGARLVRFSAKKGAGKGTLIAASQMTYQIGKVHLLRVRVKGPDIVAHFDANADGKIDEQKELLFNAYDTTHSNGAVGLYTYQNGAAPGTACAKGGCWFDDLKVVTLDEAVVAPDAGAIGPDAGGGSPDAGTTDAGHDSAGDAGFPLSKDTGAADSLAAADGLAGGVDSGRPSNLDAAGQPASDVVDAGKTDVFSRVDPNKPLTLTVVSGADDDGCSAGRRGFPGALALLLAGAMLLWRRRRYGMPQSSD